MKKIMLIGCTFLFMLTTVALTSYAEYNPYLNRGEDQNKIFGVGGEGTYNRNCLICHGGLSIPYANVTKLTLQRKLSKHNPETLKNIIRKGYKSSPAFGADMISEDELSSLINYLLNHRDGKT